LIASGHSQELLEDKLREFSCAMDSDVETFIRSKAIDYEKAGYSRTFIYEAKDKGVASIAAYFTVAITSVSFADVSRSRKSKVLGGYPGRDSLDHFAGLLIAQLARADGVSKEVITGQQLIENAEEVIEQGRRFLGGKVIYLDCKEPLVEFYENNGYVLINNEPHSRGLYKMFKALAKLS
jgi:hypothetical protein